MTILESVVINSSSITQRHQLMAPAPVHCASNSVSFLLLVMLCITDTQYVNKTAHQKYCELEVYLNQNDIIL